MRAILGLALVALSAPFARAAEPTLYERIALGPLIVHGACGSIERRAQIDVKEVLKGAYPGSQLWVSYKTENFNRSPGSPRIEFQKDEESILVLEPERDGKRRIKAPDRFVLVSGPQGKIDLPAE